ncbi:hypothetical protein [Amycolatopsis sp. TNS106]|uniref:hypothetical protein n=1 Tax=Amycolatopsis sp. TNS106 TaxID=2861750 RepID=UPI001C584AE7|nr:hypothetical protein [Amycolatopsis sp. TNS106]QXV57382.1 hypothetical protein CVV72_10400 [Amycolatopsis sp. TNS106]
MTKGAIMAQLKGKGAMTGVNLIAKVYDSAKTKDGTTHFIDVQVDGRDHRGPGQTNLHLKSERTTTEDGTVRYENQAPYSASQLQEIKNAAGPKQWPLLSRKDGQRIGTMYSFKGDVMPAARGSGLVVNTKSVGSSEFKVDATTLDHQHDCMRAARRTPTGTTLVTPPGSQHGAALEPMADVGEPTVG